MVRLVASVAAGILSLSSLGCSFDPSAHTAAATDGSLPSYDASATDGQSADAAFVDAPLPDSASVDAALFDAPLADAAILDAAILDAAILDATIPDATIPDAAIPDAVPPDAVPPDAQACDKPVAIQLTINGVLVPAGSAGAQCAATTPSGRPYVDVLLGDTVQLDASGSCAQSGAMTFSWQLAPNDGTEATIEPSSSAATITAYSLQPDRDYVVLLTVSAPGAEATCAVTAFRTHGWQALGTGPGNGDIRDLSYGSGALWIAARDGAYFTNSFDGTFALVDDNFTGVSPSDDLSTVWYDRDARYAWFGHKNNKDGLWRVDDLDGLVTYHKFDAVSALDNTATVRDIGPGFVGVQVGTNRGATAAPDNNTFVGQIAPSTHSDVRAMERSSVTSWGGGRYLWNLAAPAADIDALQVSADNKIRALYAAATHNELWIASDGEGVALVTGDTGAPVALWRMGDDGLGDNKVRDLLLEPSGSFAGDVWAATQSGVSRYKRDRQLWVHMGSPSGLTNRIDLKAIAMDPATRTIYAASNGGIVYIRLP